MEDKEKIAIVTGANSGLGLETTKSLISKDYRIIMACRNLVKAEQAKNLILKENSSAKLDIEYIDTSKLSTVRAFFKNFSSNYSSCDLLINNAGAIQQKFSLSEDGFEMQFATNYLGHFLLTGLMLNILNKTKGSRIISLGSIAHNFAKLKLNDINNSKTYSPFKTYSNTKLACIIFAYELQRKLDHTNTSMISLVAHPGISVTNFSDSLPSLLQKSQDIIGRKIFSNQKEGAESTIYAALNEKLKGGEFIGPSGLFGIKGKPKIVQSNAISNNKEFAEALWKYSENATDIKYPF